MFEIFWLIFRKLKKNFKRWCTLRTGKSYTASRILGSNDAFELGNTTESHTKGIWIGTKMLIKYDQLIIVFDCEGIESVKQVEEVIFHQL